MWDDHNFGCNDGDRTFWKKRLVRDIYLDFIGEPSDSERRKETDRGIYQDYLIVTHDNLKVSPSNFQAVDPRHFT